MKTYSFDALDEDRARKFIGCKVIDETDELVGKVDGLWMDPSTHRVAYLGVKSSWLSRNVHVVPAGNVQITEEGSITMLGYPSAFVKNAPAFDPEVELAQVEKEEINAYFARFTSIRRISSVEEIRPEEAIKSRTADEETEPHGSSPRSAEVPHHIESSEQAFFNQAGFVTDSMPEVDASKELLLTQKEAQARNRDDRIKSGSFD